MKKHVFFKKCQTQLHGHMMQGAGRRATAHLQGEKVRYFGPKKKVFWEHTCLKFWTKYSAPPKISSPVFS